MEFAKWICTLTGYLVALLILTGCQAGGDDGFIDNFLGVEIIVPVDLSMSITSPSTNSKVGYLTTVTGTCNSPGSVVEYSGPSTGFAVCDVDKTWSADIDLSSVPVGNVTIYFKATQSTSESATQSVTYYKSNNACDTETQRTADFATASSPYFICTPEQLSNIKNLISASKISDTFILKNSINFKNSLWTTIEAELTGEFDGNGFSISNVLISEPTNDGVGIFRNLSGTVKDLEINNISINGRHYVGIIAATTLTASSTATLTNITIKNASITGRSNVGGLIGKTGTSTSLDISNIDIDVDINANDHIGGLVGVVSSDTNTATINNVQINGTVTGTQFIGGMAGQMASTSSTITDASFTGTVIASSIYAGGLVGHLSNASITNGTVNANVTSTHNTSSEAVLGGFIGYALDINTIDNSSFTGTVTSFVGRVGGFIGTIRGGGTITNSASKAGTISITPNSYSANYVGGFIGTISHDTTVQNSYSKINIELDGVITSSYIGGFVGIIRNATIEDSYATGKLNITNGDGISSGGNSFGGFIGKIEPTLTETDAVINNCSASGNLSIVSANNTVYAGGFVGYTITNDSGTQSVTITNSSASGNVVSVNQYNGGFAGRIYRHRNGDYITLTNISASGNVTVSQYGDTSTTQRAGGLIGSSEQHSSAPSPGNITVNTASASGNVTIIGDPGYGKDVGGIFGNFVVSETSVATLNQLSYIGSTLNTHNSDIGGLIGRLMVTGSSNASLTNGAVTSTQFTSDGTGGSVGGAIGSAEAASTASLAINNIQVNPMNITSTGPSTGGLIGVLIGNSTGTTIVQNSFSKANITSTDIETGGLIGGMYGYTQIETSYATGNVTSSGSYLGGLVGGSESINRSITNSYAKGNVTATGSSQHVGGLVGYMKGTISNSYATGYVSSAGNNTGGLVGTQRYASVDNSFATGSVASSGENIGGLVGYIADSSTITNAFAAGSVTGISAVGGLVGYLRAGAGDVDTTYALGAINRSSGSSNQFGQICGDCDNDTSITNSFYNSNTSNIDSSVASPETDGNNGRNKTSAELQNSSTYPVSFDFSGSLNSSWRMPSSFKVPGNSNVYKYPVPYWLEN